MSARARWTAIGLVLVAPACSDIASPLRDDFYEWRLLVPSPSGPGTDSLSFHWPEERLPVRIWVEDSAGLPANFARAIAAWRDGFLYGEFDGALVSDSTRADVIVRAGAPPGPKLAAHRLHSALAPECAGATDLDVSDDHEELRLPIRVYLDPRSDPDAAGLAECLSLTSIHELGHALGIFRHSENPADLMFADPTVPLPSERDRATAEVLYHLPSTLGPVDPNS